MKENNIYAVEMQDINMIFNKKIIANKNINLKVKKGEIHAIIGENGAGKSTLMSILFGIYQPTKGKIFINGKEEIINNPVKANHLKIGMVHQHFQIIDIYRLWENIALGYKTKGFLLNKREIEEKINIIMNKYNLNIDINKLAKKASVGDLQKTEILKLLFRDNEILVFDEPSAVLTLEEIEGLLQVMKNLKKDGKTIILITHKMNEIKEVADTATVIRRGEVVGHYDVKTTSVETLSQAMVGREIVEVRNSEKSDNKKVVLDIRNLVVSKFDNQKVVGLKDFNMKLHAGEIVGIAGVEGNGQQELVNSICGLQRIKSGDIAALTKKQELVSIKHASIEKRYKKFGMSFVPLDRQKHGLVLNFNIINNIILQDIDNKRFSNFFGFLKFSNIVSYGQKIVNKYDIRNAELGFATTSTLSGGNQQKIIIGREISRKGNFIVIFQPTRGVDIGSIEFIHQQIIDAKKQGKAILLVSFELSEIISLSDRVIVLNSGNIVGELEKNKLSFKEIGNLMVSQKEN
ncbi:ABC transporter ATP-binding protein [Spiroplasma endosymbiont of Aspidapion aeneum]|uniref:ABC transporter ATP-binding protein n=1 Tax=Spiroplasma endosymbiont of Aspidapion aeneum TaxID=3066276 RepID=UPI00313B0B7B